MTHGHIWCKTSSRIAALLERAYRRVELHAVTLADLTPDETGVYDTAMGVWFVTGCFDLATGDVCAAFRARSSDDADAFIGALEPFVVSGPPGERVWGYLMRDGEPIRLLTKG